MTLKAKPLIFAPEIKKKPEIFEIPFCKVSIRRLSLVL